MIIPRDAYPKMIEWKKRRELQTSRNMLPRAMSLEGPRQSGKTFLAKKFAAENYQDSVYINLTDEEDLNTFVNICKERPMMRGKKLFQKVFSTFNPTFKDAPETLVIIDEIQESHYIYNKIRSILESCDFHLLISGSYLGMIIGKKEFFTPIGNLDIIEVMPVSFQEYLKAIGQHERFMHLHLFGKSNKADYAAIHEAYETYIRVGGYPEVLSSYMEFGDSTSIADMHMAINKFVMEECRKYITNDADFDVFKEQCEKVPKTLLDEKRGMSLDFREIYKSDTREMDYANVKAVLFNMKSCGLLNYCYWAEDCDLRKVSSLPMRLYYNDVGMASSLLTGENPDHAPGVAAENFVYLSLNDPNRLRPGEMHRHPAFGTFEISSLSENKDSTRLDSHPDLEVDYTDNPMLEVKIEIGEIDFLKKSKITRKTVALDVKKGNKSSKTAQFLLASGKVDYILYARGGRDVKGGISADGKVVTIPIYLIDRYDFDKDYQKDLIEFK